MYTTMKEFYDSWAHESTMTLRVVNALTDASLSQAVAPDHRTIGRIAWHIVTTIPEMLDNMGIEIDAVTADAPMPTTAKEIVAGYQGVAKQVVDRLNQDWDDSVLTTEVDMYGQKWKRGAGLTAVVQHEIHHRGQLTVLLRQAGLRVPSIYGPAKEDWEQMGAEAPEI